MLIYSFQALLENKLKSFLTMFGIIIGIASVMFISSLGNTLNDVIREIYPYLYGQTRDQIWVYVSDDMGHVKYLEPDVVENFIEKYESQMDTYLRTSDYTYDGVLKISDQNYSRSRVFGVSAGYDDFCSLILTEGRFINERDCREVRSSIVISDIAAKNCFGEESALGKEITLQGDSGEYVSYVVVGVYKYLNSDIRESSGRDMRKVATTSFTSYTYHDKLLGYDNYHEGLSYLIMVPRSDMNEEQKNNLVNNAYAYFYNLYGDNYTVTSQIIYSDYRKVDSISFTITAVFLLIASIALVVGGIGVMNTLFISVSERTKEIGIRKALGAKNWTIKWQFLSESLIICSIAGVLGILLGCILDYISTECMPMIIQRVPDSFGIIKPLLLTIDITVQPTIQASVISVCFIVVTGILFGFIPASKAAKMNPVDALREE